MENKAKSRDIIIPEGTKFYHGTTEPFDVRKIGVGGYDKVLWTSKSIKIAQAYLPYGFNIYNVSARNIINVFTYDEDANKADKEMYHIIAKQIGFTENILHQIYEKVEKVNQKVINLELKLKKYKEQYDKYEREMTQEDSEEVMNKMDKLCDEWSKEEDELSKIHYVLHESLMKKFVMLKMKKLFGYEASPYDSYNIYWDSDKKMMLPASYKRKGRIIILTPKRDMLFYNYAEGKESDLTDVEYHHLGVFRKVEEKGYDGIIINDFAQTKEYGNYGHISYGFFRSAIKDLNIRSISQQVHPEKMEGKKK